MIHEVDEGLRLLLVDAGLQESGVDLVFDAPTKDWSARRNAPTISVFLHRIREDATRRRTGAAEEHDDQGLVIGWRTPPRWFELTYLVTAWTNRPQDEHRLLAEVLRCLVRSDVLPARMHTGSLAELGLAVEIEAAGPGTDGPSASDVWSALGGELKAAIDLRVWAPLAGERTAAGPPVTEGLVVKSASARDGEGAEPGRRLRYDGASDPGAQGFAAERERQLPPGRRRRGGAAR
ncbi:DUF4255 domain-containing protein [Streptomyces sp. NPDC007076]|uniref:DUF4255 domain-containing protein n=1 Tax=unclassified Streptomyces TaxID=2593676 RepID=UPI002E371C78|nr:MULTISPECIES: DUF4255 domain-containing protein [unclassified Streptomyces]MEE1840064.1 DUF4255 domain-containing protein [Streptomyces sp. JV190]